MSARLAVFHLRKKAYGQFEPPRLFDHVTKMVGDKRYDAHLLVDYTEQELDELDEYLITAVTLTLVMLRLNSLKVNT